MTSREPHHRALSTRLLQECLQPQIRLLVEQRRFGVEKITLSELARRVGYDSLSGLHAVMNGKAQPPLHVLVGLAVELKLHSIEELFGDFGSASATVDQKTT